MSKQLTFDEEETSEEEVEIAQGEVKHVLSLGAGVNSTALLIYLVKNRMPLDYVVFADTGNEMPETYIAEH